MITRTIALRNNNPCNIRYSSKNDWKGQIGSDKGFCVFANMSYGYRAAMKLVQSYIKKGYDTVGDIISRWAPPSENDTKAYISNVCGIINAPYHSDYMFFIGTVDRDTKVRTVAEIGSLVFAMSFVEIGLPISPSSILKLSSDDGAEYDYYINHFLHPALEHCIGTYNF